MADDKKIIQPIDADFDEVAKAMITPATPLPNNSNALALKSGQSPAPYVQLKLDLGIEVEKVVGGIEMGVLENGIPYLTQRGLADMTGAARSTIQELTQEWQTARETEVWPRGRMQFFRDYLTKAGFNDQLIANVREILSMRVRAASISHSPRMTGSIIQSRYSSSPVGVASKRRLGCERNSLDTALLSEFSKEFPILLR